MQAIFETAFDIIYLVSVITLGIIIVKGSRGNRQFSLFGIMAIVLGAGDAFHLVPRAVALCTTGLESYTAALGFGKLVTSITMTVFYVILYHIWLLRYGKKERLLTASVYALAAIRIILCLMPQNDWLSAAPPLSWHIPDPRMPDQWPEYPGMPGFPHLESRPARPPCLRSRRIRTYSASHLHS